MVRAPFILTPLVRDVLCVLSKSRQSLSPREVSKQLPTRRYDAILKALGRMRTTGWVTFELMSQLDGPPQMGYRLKDEHRNQASVILIGHQLPVT